MNEEEAGGMVRSEAVRDPIHGYVPFSTAERRGIDSREVQRLRRIAQLGLTELVYPGARHSRFEHAIGTLAVVTRLFEALRGRLGTEGFLGPIGRNPSESEFGELLEIARWTALLHDLGHAPLSHVTESLLPAGETHEDRTLRLVRGGEIGDALAAAGDGVRDGVLACLDLGSPPGDPGLAFVREAITGPLGADRMDYLLRDSRATGVSYGLFDIERMLHTLVPIEREDAPGARLGVDRGGVLATEGMLWARTSMFQQVYLHRTRRVLDHHLRSFLAAVLPGGAYPAELDAFLEWDDPRVWEELRCALRDPGGAGHDDAVRILRRGHHRALPYQVEGSVEEVGAALERWRDRVLAIDPAADPWPDLVRPPHDPSRSGEIPVRDATGRVQPLSRVSGLVERMAQTPYGRLYVDRRAAEGLGDAARPPGSDEDASLRR